MFVLVLQSCLWWFCIAVIEHTSQVLLAVCVQCWVHALSGRWSGFLLVCVLVQVWWIPEIPAEAFASAPEANTPTPTTAKPAVWSLPTAVSISGLCCFCPNLLDIRSLYLLLNNSRKWLWNFLQFRLLWNFNFPEKLHAHDQILTNSIQFYPLDPWVRLFLQLRVTKGEAKQGPWGQLYGCPKEETNF